MKSFLLPALVTTALLASCGGGTGGTPSADTSAPTVSLSAVQSGTTVKLTATATDDRGVTQVQFYRGSVLLGSDTAAPYEWSDPVTRANNGTASYTARASDAAGNVAAGTAQLNVSVPSLYQGVWGWGILDANETLLDSGAVVYSDEDLYEGRPVALGAFVNKAQTLSGGSLLGPVTAVGQLETAFLQLDSTGAATTPYFAGGDDDNQLGSYQGNATFEGSGAIFAGGQPSQAVYIVMIQTSTDVPTGAALTTARGQARAAASALATRERQVGALSLKPRLGQVAAIGRSVLAAR